MRSHLTILNNSASLYPTRPIFKVPRLDPSNGAVDSWISISYKQFNDDVERFARFWLRTLQRDNVPQRSVVGVWVGGFTYTDVCQIYGLSRAGYVPQLFSLKLPNPVVIYELIKKANAKALVHDLSFKDILNDCPVLAYASMHVEHDTPDTTLPDLCNFDAEDTVFIFHTSGSTSGSPKLVPCTFRWLNTVMDKSYQTCKPRNPDRQDVTVAMGSMCHIAQTYMLIGSLQYASCVIQPSSVAFSTTELVDMIARCGLNRLNQFASFLARSIRAARTDAKLLSLLSNLDEILYSGLPLSHEEEAWAHQQGLKLRNLFGSTECSGMLLSIGSGRNPGLLKPLDGFSYRFIPTGPASAEGAHQSTARLLELVILSESPDCPDKSLRQADGHFHTGDLFQETSPGLYVFRGRDDDWIKSENSLRCDTKAIEDNVLTMCGNLISEVVVVGTGRPSPVMFIEPAADIEPAKLKKDIIRKTRQFHSRRYMHERITSPDMIVVVPPQSLPRTATKGNIRRKAVEEAYKVEIDRIFESRQ